MEHVADELGVPYLHLPVLQRELSPRSDAEAIRTLRRIIRERQPNVLHTHTAKAGATGRLAALTVRTGPPGRRRPHLPRPRAERLLQSEPRARVPPARADARLVDRRAGRRQRRGARRSRADAHRAAHASSRSSRTASISTHASSGPLANRARIRAELGIADDAFVIGWAGRLTAIKRPLDLVRVTAGVDGALLVLVGDGEDRPAAESLAARARHLRPGALPRLPRRPRRALLRVRRVPADVGERGRARRRDRGACGRRARGRHRRRRNSERRRRGRDRPARAGRRGRGAAGGRRAPAPRTTRCARRWASSAPGGCASGSRSSAWSTTPSGSTRESWRR